MSDYLELLYMLSDALRREIPDKCFVLFPEHSSIVVGLKMASRTMMSEPPKVGHIFVRKETPTLVQCVGYASIVDLEVADPEMLPRLITWAREQKDVYLNL